MACKYIAAAWLVKTNRLGYFFLRVLRNRSLENQDGSLAED